VNHGRRIDQTVTPPVPVTVGVPFDLGWAIGVLHANDTVTRTCKGCGVSVTTGIVRAGMAAEVAPAEVHHAADCPVEARLGNNPERS